MVMPYGPGTYPDDFPGNYIDLRNRAYGRNRINQFDPLTPVDLLALRLERPAEAVTARALALRRLLARLLGR